ncbi:MAG: transglycosylase domain-containing protein [Acidimicrobiales bacterium]
MRRFSALIRLFVALALLGVVVGLTAVLVGPQVVSVVTSGEWEHTSVDLAETSVRTQVFDVNGKLMTTWFKDNRSPIALDQIPLEVREAVLAIEDADFYSHQGVNFKATGRAVMENVDAGGISQGGSTITQQLVKNLVLNDDQTVARKIQEASLAVRQEAQMSKDEILEVYVNTVYCGAGAYGVKAAAEVYFGIDTTNKSDAEVAAVLDEGLGWGEAALLASLISNPDAYDPTLNPETSDYQRGIVLDRLAELEFVTVAEAEQLDATALPTKRNEVNLEAEDDFFVAEVRKLLLEDERFLGGGEESRREALFGGGLRIFTSFDPAVQALAEQARDATLRGEDPNNPRVSYDFTMSIASIDVNTGAVRAMVGGEDFDDESYNIATQGLRQPGSSFKAFTLVAALRQGIQPNDSVSGIGPCKFGDASTPGGLAEFENFGKSRGRVNTIRGLTLQSSNCGYVRIEQLAGLGNVIETAGLLGVDNSNMKEFLSLTLGAFEVTPMDMASAYATIAARGVARDPYFIERIEDDDGNIIYSVLEDERFAGEQVITQDVACWATEILEANVIGGTGTNGRLPNQPAAGKTGTAEDFADAWFVGYTPYLATAIWMGNPDSNQIDMRGVGGINVTGGSFPAQAWGAFNTAYHENLPVVEFPECPAFAQRGKYLRLAGDAPIGNNPCNENRIPLDTDRDGEPDKCRKEVPDKAYACDGNLIDDDAKDVTLYCLPKEKKNKKNKKKKDKEPAPTEQVAEPAPPEPAPAEEAAPAEPAPAEPAPAGDDASAGDSGLE